MLGISWAFNFDGLARLFVLLISGIGILVFLYSISYCGNNKTNLIRLSRILQLFTIAMLGVVLADNLIVLFVFWELTTLSSFLLIQFHYHDEAARKAALQSMMLTVLGGLAMLAGFLILQNAEGTWSIQSLLSHSVEGRVGLMTAAFILIFLGAMTKSAQFPFHFWLPGAMKAPTPVSAYLHSATMVNAGIYLLARLHPLLSHVPLWHTALAAVGLATMIISAVISLRQTDLKAILAYTTIFALGSMVYLLSGHTVQAAQALVVFLVAHALYKAALFMWVGIVDHRFGTRELTTLAGICRGRPILSIVLIVGALSMAGLPPFFGFFAKQMAYEAKLAAPSISYVLLFLSFLASALVAVVSYHLIVTCYRRNPALAAKSSMPYSEWLPMILIVATVVIGLMPARIDQWLLQAASLNVVYPDHGQHLAPLAWGQWRNSEMLSLFTVAFGVLLFIFRKMIVHFLGNVSKSIKLSASDCFDKTLSGILSAGEWLTNCTQELSLNKQISITILAMISMVLLGFGFISFSSLQLNEVYQNGFVIFLCVLMLVFSAALIFTKRFLPALIYLGIIGVAVSVYFLLQGAPDVAMTQLLIEILTVIIVVIAFHRKSTDLTVPTRSMYVKLWHGFVSVLAGAVTVLLLLLVVSQSPSDQLSSYFVHLAYPLAHGKNIVNVILVDFRALDTLGESVVIAAAAIGIWVLVRLRKEK